MNEWCIYIALYCVLLYTQSALQSCVWGGVSSPQPPPMKAARNLTLVYLTSLLFDFLPVVHLIWLAQTVLNSSKRVNLYLMTFKLLLQTPSHINTLLSVCLQWLPSNVSKHKGNLRFKRFELHCFISRTCYASEVCRTLFNKMYWYAFDQWGLATACLFSHVVSSHVISFALAGLSSFLATRYIEVNAWMGPGVKG